MSKKLSEKKTELAGIVEAARILSEKAKDSDLSDAEKKERTALLTKAEAIQVEVKALEEDEALESKIQRIGAEILGPPAKTEAGQPRYRDVVDMLLKSDSFREMREKSRDDSKVEFKADPWDPAAENAGDAMTHMRPGIVPIDGVFPLKVADLFSQAPMEGSSISYIQMTDADGAASDTAITVQFGGSADSEVDVTQNKAFKVTTRYIVPDESLSDLPALEAQLRNMLLVGPNGLGEKVEDNALNGDGATAIKGILDYTPDEETLSGAATRLSTRIFAAATEVANAGFDADAVVINPTDAFALHIEEDDNKRPLWGSWGSPYAGQNGLPSQLRFAISRKVAAGTVLVGAFRSATLYTRQAASLRASREGLGLADKDLVLFVASARHALVNPYGKKPFRTVTITP
jgi:hypothetical protein